MLQCWENDADKRPTFSDIVGSLSQSLEALVGYMDISAFSVSQPLVLETCDPSITGSDVDDTSGEYHSDGKFSELQESPAGLEETNV